MSGRNHLGSGWLSSLCTLALWVASPVGAVTSGQVDDFQDATLQGWTGGSSYANQPNGGPAGSGDRYLEIDSLAFLLGAFNTAQWSGDYDAEEVLAVGADLNNFGPDEVSLRIVIFTPGCDGGAGACTAWTSTDATVLGAGSGWVNAEFSLEEADLTRVLGSDSFTATLQNVERLLIRHQSGAPAAPGAGDTVNAVLGVDNITALPEPSPGVALAVGALALLALRRRHR